jgi:hypothetical protein
VAFVTTFGENPGELEGLAAGIEFFQLAEATSFKFFLFMCWSSRMAIATLLPKLPQDTECSFYVGVMCVTVCRQRRH